MRIVKNDSTLLSPPVVQPLLITGASGTLGRAFARICHTRGLPAVVLSRAEMDITNPEAINRALAKYQPWAVINTAGYVRVDEAETDFRRCYRENAYGPVVLASACARLNLPYLTYSSDLVFDGQKDTPYLESDVPRSLNVYGHSKRLAERDTLAAYPDALVVRTSAFFGPWDEYNFVHHVLQAAGQGAPFEAVDDAYIAPTYVPDLVNTSLDLLIDASTGIWHVANQTACSWAELARTAAVAAGFDPSFVVPRPQHSFQWPAPRPHYSVLSSERGTVLPTLENALRRYLADAPAVLSAVENNMAAAS